MCSVGIRTKKSIFTLGTGYAGQSDDLNALQSHTMPDILETLAQTWTMETLDNIPVMTEMLRLVRGHCAVEGIRESDRAWPGVVCDQVP